MTAANLDQQYALVLTSHPLQRIGAYALARLAEASAPSELTRTGFLTAVADVTRDAISAAKHRETTAPRAFWLKASISFFPNSKMNHNAQRRKDNAVLDAEISAWRSLPDLASWPGVACALCGRTAVGFYGKVDVPLAESDLYRNNTPPGHRGLALCWPCVCSFHALPYGCQLTGGPSIALHSWDERFLRETVALHVDRNEKYITSGVAVDKGSGSNREVAALRALRRYEHELTDGVELVVFSNHNNGQMLEIHTLEQPMAEWLRRTFRRQRLRAGFGALLQAHRTEKLPGKVGLARNAFRAPERIPGACVRYLANRVGPTGRIPSSASDLSRLCFSFAKEVMRMKQKDLEEIEATARGVALLLSLETSAGKLRELYSMRNKPGRLRSWLQAKALQWRFPPEAWNTDPPKGYDPGRPLMGTRSFNLLFDPDPDSFSWFHRNLLFVAVLETLHVLDWRPTDGTKVAAETAEDAEDLHPEDKDLMEAEEHA